MMDSILLFLICSQVSYKLHKLADRKGPDALRFKRLANSVEEFTYCLLDPLKTDPGRREQFGDFCLDEVLKDAIEFEQKKVILNDYNIIFPEGVTSYSGLYGEAPRERDTFFTLVMYGRVTKSEVLVFERIVEIELMGNNWVEIKSKH